MVKVLRPQRHTLLIVHEGYAEGSLLAHLKTLYVSRSSTLALTMQNARGGGGRHVLDHALRVRRRTTFDEVAILTDTDQDWDDAQRERARAGRILALESSPCLEAWLLGVHRHAVPANGAQIKRDFERFHGGPAHDPRVYPRHFPKDTLDNARARLSTLDQILRLLRV
jgi:hypothetical protein